MRSLHYSLIYFAITHLFEEAFILPEGKSRAALNEALNFSRRRGSGLELVMVSAGSRNIPGGLEE